MIQFLDFLEAQTLRRLNLIDLNSSNASSTESPFHIAMRFPSESECDVIQVDSTMADDVTGDDVERGETESNVARDNVRDSRENCQSKDKSEDFCLNNFEEPNVERVIEHLAEAENPKPGINRNRSVPYSGGKLMYGFFHSYRSSLINTDRLINIPSLVIRRIEKDTVKFHLLN